MSCRTILALVVAVTAGACSESTPLMLTTQPSTLTSSASLQIPSVLGEWSGMSAAPLRNQLVFNNPCAFRMTITSQTGASFLGTFMSFGNGAESARACDGSGSFTGIVDSRAGFIGFRFNMPFGDMRACTTTVGGRTFVDSRCW